MFINSYEELKKYVNDDIVHNDLRIFRFIDIENLSLWVEIKNFLALKCSNHIRLSTFCDSEDLTPKLNVLYAELEKIKENTLLIPLSEHLRINTSKCNEVLLQIINIQYTYDVYSAKAHLYIPMYRMKNSLQLLLARDPRLFYNIIFLKAEKRDDEYSLTIVSKEVQYLTLKGNVLNGYKEYLSYWEENPVKPIILCTEHASIYRDNVFFDNVKVLLNAFDVINFYNLLPYSLEEKFGNDWLWNELLRKLQSAPNTTNLSVLFFETPNIKPEQLLVRWNESGDFEKWLIWLWLKIEAKNLYLAEVIKKSSNYKYFIQDLTCCIFDFSVDNLKSYLEIYSERKRLLEAIQLEDLPSNFWEKLDEVADDKKLFYLTGVTKKEREKIIGLIGKVDFTEELKRFLEYAYPALYAYLSEYTFDEKLFTDYFNKYKMQKIRNVFTDEFIKEVSDLAVEKGVWWKLRPRNNLINEIYDDRSYIYWVDALGVEFLSLIQHVLSNKYRDVYYYIKVGYANIPTITDLNKDFVIGRNYGCFRDLDNLKHQGDYPYCIEEELRIIEQVIKNAVQKLELYEQVIITSDHGSSRGAILWKEISKKVREEAKVERFGRYCIDNESYEKIYVDCIDKEEYHIFASYSRFSIGGNEKSEIHGGATLEEVLVPIIVLSQAPLEEKVVIVPLESEVKLKPGTLPKIKFKVNKKFDQLYAVVDARKYVCKKESDYWYFEPEVGRKENYSAKIMSKGSIGEFAYRIIKGRTDSDRFNI